MIMSVEMGGTNARQKSTGDGGRYDHLFPNPKDSGLKPGEEGVTDHSYVDVPLTKAEQIRFYLLEFPYVLVRYGIPFLLGQLRSSLQKPQKRSF